MFRLESTPWLLSLHTPKVTVSVRDVMRELKRAWKYRFWFTPSITVSRAFTKLMPPSTIDIVERSSMSIGSSKEASECVPLLRKRLSKYSFRIEFIY